MPRFESQFTKENIRPDRSDALEVHDQFDDQEDLRVEVSQGDVTSTYVYLRKPEVALLHDHLSRLLGDDDPEPELIYTRKELVRRLAKVREEIAEISMSLRVCCYNDAKYTCDSVDAVRDELRGAIQKLIDAPKLLKKEKR